MSAPRYGGRVRVVIEGEAYPNDGGKHFNVYNGAHGYVGSFQIDRRGVTVEKIEPPVEVFKPGDFVRSKSTGQVFLITTSGYVQVKPYIAQHNDWGTSLGGPSLEAFVADTDLERVEYAEVPF